MFVLWGCLSFGVWGDVCVWGMFVLLGFLDVCILEMFALLGFLGVCVLGMFVLLCFLDVCVLRISGRHVRCYVCHFRSFSLQRQEGSLIFSPTFGHPPQKPV